MGSKKQEYESLKLAFQKGHRVSLVGWAEVEMPAEACRHGVLSPEDAEAITKLLEEKELIVWDEDNFDETPLPVTFCEVDDEEVEDPDDVIRLEQDATGNWGVSST